jgi:hypothetical protein
MVGSTILALVFALARAAHGGGYVSRLLSILIMALGFALVHISTYGLIDAVIAGLIAFSGLYLGLVFGWGKGFAAITGRYFVDEKDFLPADLVGDWIYKKYGNAKLAGAAFFTARSIAFFPLFIVLAMATEEYGYLLSSLSVLSMGVVYYGAGRVIEESKAVRLAEVVYFAIIGAALA